MEEGHQYPEVTDIDDFLCERGSLTIEEVLKSCDNNTAFNSFISQLPRQYISSEGICSHGEVILNCSHCREKNAVHTIASVSSPTQIMEMLQILPIPDNQKFWLKTVIGVVFKGLNISEDAIPDVPKFLNEESSEGYNNEDKKLISYAFQHLHAFIQDSTQIISGLGYSCPLDQIQLCTIETMMDPAQWYNSLSG